MAFPLAAKSNSEEPKANSEKPKAENVTVFLNAP
jgi:hypothetical protein